MKRITLLSMILAFFWVTAAHSATAIYFDNVDCQSDSFMKQIGGIQFEILDQNVSINDFQPAGTLLNWANFSTQNKKIVFFDFNGNAPLSNGLIGSFDTDVQLGNWELADQKGSAHKVPEFMVDQSGYEYSIKCPTNPVPIPSAIILLASGFAGLAGLKKIYS